jgi:hypothetical protein
MPRTTSLPSSPSTVLSAKLTGTHSRPPPNVVYSGHTWQEETPLDQCLAVVPIAPESVSVFGTSRCRVAQRCVLVGELLWNEQKQKIMPFYKIRRYVLRAGRRLGCAENSPPSEDERLMIVSARDILSVCVLSSYHERILADAKCV